MPRVWPRNPFSHAIFLAIEGYTNFFKRFSRPLFAGAKCYVYQSLGHCPRGVTCRWGGAHLDSRGRNLKNQEVFTGRYPYPIMFGYRLRPVGTIRRYRYRVESSVPDPWRFSTDPYSDPDLGSDLCLMDPAPYPTLFFSDLEYASKVFMLIPF